MPNLLSILLHTLYQVSNNHGGAKSEGGSSGNAINGISPNNPQKIYLWRQQKKNLEENNMMKQRRTEGAILEINVENQYYVYAQILKKALGYAFFDYRTKEKLTDFQILNDAKVLFIVAVYNDVITQGKWLKVHKLPIRESLLVLPMKFIQDILQPENFELYDPNTGEITRTTKDKIIGLERAAVWDAFHVEDRIRDYYLGVPNFWLEQMKVK